MHCFVLIMRWDIPEYRDINFFENLKIRIDIYRDNYFQPFAENDPEQLGNTLVIWYFTERKRLEVSWARKAGSNYGYTNSIIGDSLLIWTGKSGSFEFKKGDKVCPLHGIRLISRTVF